MPEPVSTTAIIGAATIGAGASLAGAAMQAGATKKASAQEWAMYLQNREDLAPWREAGATAVKSLGEMVAAGPGTFTESPSYQFRLDEGTRALNRAAAARGQLGSGAQQKNLLRYGQNYATNEYDNFLNRYYQSLTPLQSLSGLGQTSAGQTAQLGANTASNMGNLTMAQGNARASGFTGLGNTAMWAADQYNLNSLFNNRIQGLPGGTVGIGTNNRWVQG